MAGSGARGEPDEMRPGAARGGNALPSGRVKAAPVLAGMSEKREWNRDGSRLSCMDTFVRGVFL